MKKGHSLFYLLGNEWVIAGKNILRNKSAYQPIIRSLALGSALLLTISGLILQASQISNMMSGRDIMMVEYSSVADQSEDGAKRAYRKTENPICYDTAQEITDELSQYDGGLEVFGFGSDGGKYYVVIEKKYIAEDMLPFLPEINDTQVEARVDVITVDQKNYKKLCKEAGVPVGSTILMNLYHYNQKGVMTDVVPYKENISQVALEDISGNKTVLSIDGMYIEIRFLKISWLYTLRRCLLFCLNQRVAFSPGLLIQQIRLIYESIICASTAAIRGIPIGLLIPFVMNLSIRNGFPVTFQVPWLMLATSTVM